MKTKFSRLGLMIVIFALLPTVIFTPELVVYERSLPVIIHLFTAVPLGLTLVLLTNTNAPAFDRRSRLFSLAAICYGMHLLFLVLYRINAAGYSLILTSHIFLSLNLFFFSLDIKNWYSLALSILFLITILVRDAFFLGGLI